MKNAWILVVVAMFALSACSFRKKPSAEIRYVSDVTILPDGRCQVRQNIQMEGDAIFIVPDGNPEDPETKISYGMMHAWFRDAVDGSVLSLEHRNGGYRIELLGTIPNLASLVEHAPDLLGPQAEGLEVSRDADGHLCMQVGKGKTKDKKHLDDMRLQLQKSPAIIVFDFTLHFPGKILSSTLPVLDERSLRWFVDSRQEQDLNLLADRIASGWSVVVDVGSMPLPEKPLKHLRKEENKRNTPIFPDILASPSEKPWDAKITRTLIVRENPLAGEPLPDPALKEKPFFHSSDSVRDPGVYLDVSVFAPQGRELFEWGKSIILRQCSALGNDGQKLEVRSASLSDFPNLISASTSLIVKVDLPPLSKQGLQSLDLTLEILTCTRFEEQRESINLGPRKISLEKLIPGAVWDLKTCAITGDTLNVNGPLRGPKEIRTLSVSGESLNEHDKEHPFRPNYSDRVVQTGGQWRREFGTWSSGGSISSYKNLLIRRPIDLRREQVTISLKNVTFP